jgi:hypothetical protein|tara:strand:+ start:1351 stop:1707 length:357 start_codon:yes stop_codon:yes gene_type:complete
MVELWTPQGSTYVGEELVGHNGETAASIVIHTFQFHDPVTDRRQMVKIPADPEVSRDHVEDMAAQALENFLLECKGFNDKKKPTEDQRKEIGKQIEEFRVYNAKRKESTNNRIYYRGT